MTHILKTGCGGRASAKPTEVGLLQNLQGSDLGKTDKGRVSAGLAKMRNAVIRPWQNYRVFEGTNIGF